jgi:hypothetical protein
MSEPQDSRGEPQDAGFSEKAQLETLAHVPLTAEQTEKIRQDLGIEVGFLLAQRASRTAAREIDPGLIAVTRLTWCW